LTYISAYKKSFAEGEYNIKEPVTTPSGQVIRSYFSGGLALANMLPGDASSPIKDPINAVTFAGSSPVVGNGFGKDMFSISGTPDGVVSSAVVASSPQFTQLEDKMVPPFFADILKGVGLKPEQVEVLRLKGEMPVDQVLNQFYTRQVVETSIGQAIGSRLFAGIGAKRGKGVADANAVEFSRRSIMSFIMRNPKEAIVIMADEGERDDSVSLKRGRIYSSIYEAVYWDPDQDSFKESLNDEIMRLRRLGIKISYFAGDALEHTNGLIIPRAYAKATNSWSLAALLDDLSDGIRRTVWDRFRIAGISFDAPDSANVQPLDLPSVATRKVAVSLARQQGIKEKDVKFNEFYANYMNHLAILTLGSRKKNLAKEPLQSGDSRHARIIDDVKKLQKIYPGLRLLTPGDGDFAPRVVASLGLDLGDGYKMMVFGRSGAAEASIAKLVSALVEGAQFSNRFVSETNTALDVSEVTAVNFTDEDKEMYENLGYDADVFTRTYNRFDFRGKGTFAMTAVTGAADTVTTSTGEVENFFGKMIADLLPRVDFNGNEGLVTTSTLTATSDGSVFIIRAHFKSEDMADTEDKILTASLEAAQFVKDQIDSSKKKDEGVASSAVLSEKEREESLSRISAIDTRLAKVWAGFPAGTLQMEDVAFNSVIAVSHILKVLEQKGVSRDKAVEAINKELELLKEQIEKLKAYNGKHVMLFLEKAVMNHYRVIEAEFNNLISSLQGLGIHEKPKIGRIKNNSSITLEVNDDGSVGSLTIDRTYRDWDEKADPDQLLQTQRTLNVSFSPEATLVERKVVAKHYDSNAYPDKTTLSKAKLNGQQIVSMHYKGEGTLEVDSNVLIVEVTPAFLGELANNGVPLRSEYWIRYYDPGYSRHIQHTFTVEFVSAGTASSSVRKAFTSHDVETAYDLDDRHTLWEIIENAEDKEVVVAAKHRLMLYHAKHLPLSPEDERLGELEKRMVEEAKRIKAFFNSPRDDKPWLKNRSSSPVQENSGGIDGGVKAPGGIDFRAMNIKYQAMGSFVKLDLTLPKLSRVELQSMDIDVEILSIQRMANSSIEPSAKRLEEVLAACVQKGELNQRREALAACAMDICQMQEMNAAESSPELRRVIVLLDQISSGS
ncbi:MAG: hypothetical protein HY761_07130, partial [Candidatus Omnitrophica bacterium]|nr:hypothetical protein [Candidatus Omnitrophota bacterium]